MRGALAAGDPMSACPGVGRRFQLRLQSIAGIQGLFNCFVPIKRDNLRSKLWNLETQQEIMTLGRLGRGAGSACFASDGSCLVTASVDGRVQLWRAPSFDEITVAETIAKAQVQKP